MQCPECGYIDEDFEMGEDATCPDCGAQLEEEEDEDELFKEDSFF